MVRRLGDRRPGPARRCRRLSRSSHGDDEQGGRASQTPPAGRAWPGAAHGGEPSWSTTGPVTDVPLLDRGSPETKQGPAVANPRIRVCSTVVFSAAPCHARPSTGYFLPNRSGDEHSWLRALKRDMRVARRERLVPSRPWQASLTSLPRAAGTPGGAGASRTSPAPRAWRRPGSRPRASAPPSVSGPPRRWDC